MHCIAYPALEQHGKDSLVLLVMVLGPGLAGWMAWMDCIEIPITSFGMVLALARMLLCFARGRIIDELLYNGVPYEVKCDIPLRKYLCVDK